MVSKNLSSTVIFEPSYTEIFQEKERTPQLWVYLTAKYALSKVLTMLQTQESALDRKFLDDWSTVQWIYDSDKAMTKLVLKGKDRICDDWYIYA